MKVGQNSAIRITDLFTGTLQYRVPRYQRRYIWDETNWKVLWGDITQLLRTEKEGQEHFVGTIVTQPNKTGGVLEKHEIIDGQQRLTTLQVIFCVIRDISASDSGLQSKIKDILELPEYDAMREKTRMEKIADSNTQDMFSPYRFIPKGHDRYIFQSLIERETAEQRSGISDAYEYFKGEITTYLKCTGFSLVDLMDVLSGSLHVIQIRLGAEDEPEKIFESINDTGRALDEFDYLWNHLFLRTRKLGESKSDNLYDMYWKKFEDEPYWNPAERRELFFRKFLMAKRGPRCFESMGKSVKAFDVYREYSRTLLDDPEYIKTHTDKLDMEQVEYEFRQLSCYADSYQELHDPSLVSKDSDLSEFGNRMRFDKLILPCLDSFMLFLVHESKLVGGDLYDIFDILESYIVRRMLCAKRNEDIYGEINSFFSEAIKTSKFKVRDLVDHLYGFWPGLPEVERAFEQARSKDDNLILYILYCIECRKSGTKNSHLDFENFQGPEPIVDRQFLHDHYHAVDSIGNLMLLTSAFDEGLHSSPFDSEKKMHLMELAEGLVLTTEICAKESWNAVEIRDRTIDLLSCFEQIWKPVEEFMDDA